jgi:predicted nucleic acid-binding protein
MKNTTNKPSILIDLNILLDVLQKREPFYENSARVLSLIESGFVEGYISAHSVTTLYYLFQKGRSSADAKAAITNLLQFLKVAPINQETIDQALNLEMNDFEDAVQMIAAIQCKVDCLVTRNTKDYQAILLPVMEPVEFLNSITKLIS